MADESDEAGAARGVARRRDEQPLPPHVLARDDALHAAFSVLEACDGAVPDALPYDHDYLAAVTRECVRELFGMLDGASVPRAEQWLTAHDDEGVAVSLEDDARRAELDNNLAILVREYDEPRVGLLGHQKGTEALDVQGNTCTSLQHIHQS